MKTTSVTQQGINRRDAMKGSFGAATLAALAGGAAAPVAMSAGPVVVSAGVARAQQDTRAQVTGPATGIVMHPDYARTIAQMAYVWGWPMVNMHNRHLVFAKVPENGLGDGVLPVGPLNRLTMLTDYIKPEERAVATPNQDVVYGFGILSLEKEPVVFQVPDFGERFWIYQLCDQRTDTLGGVGKLYGTKPGFYMVAGPSWNGATPAGASTNVSKNQLVWARCHLVGLASAIGWITWSSAVSGRHSSTVRLRMAS